MKKPRVVPPSESRAKTIFVLDSKTPAKEQLIDEQVIAQTDDDSAWEAAITVNREGSAVRPPAKLVVIRTRSHR
jgi:hypothetical protein